MFDWLCKKKLTEEDKERLENEWYEKKSALMESILGKAHDMVLHAIIPYEIGGPLDLYYYPNGVKGTGVATKELSSVCRVSSRNSIYSRYELLMFTKHELDLAAADDESTPFGKEHGNIRLILNHVAPYSTQAELNPGETCEFPEDMEKVGGKCLIFDSYAAEQSRTNDERFGMMLIIEIFRDEMEFAMENGGKALLSKLRDKGVYPYSDLDRPSVLN